VPFSSVITAATGDWHAVFMLASGMAAVSALMAIFVLKPMREPMQKDSSRIARRRRWDIALCRMT
jgi:OFA family oxalate/formate antiporter-like MFS transporter